MTCEMQTEFMQAFAEIFLNHYQYQFEDHNMDNCLGLYVSILLRMAEIQRHLTWNQSILGIASGARFSPSTLFL